MTAEIGHNNGPVLEPGHVYRTFMWRQAQKRLVPKAVPLLVVKQRVKRAAELGLDYKTYASIRQFSGQDILGLLFSSNALGLWGGRTRLPEPERAALIRLRGAGRLALAHPPADPAMIGAENPVLDAIGRAPGLAQCWSQTRAHLAGFIGAQRLSANRVLIVGDTTLESQWTTAARAAGYLPADRYFGFRSETP